MVRGLVLGLEFSTQSVKALLLDLETDTVEHIEQFNYDDELPGYHSSGGVLPSKDPAVRRTSPRMILESLDLIFSRLKEAGAALGRVQALKLDAQQHSTVYTDSSLEERLFSLAASGTLVEQISPALTRAEIPIWEDRSTRREVLHLEEVLASRGGLRELTGNRGEQRFPAAQILKWGRENPAEYNATKHIFVLSAFLTSVLTGRIVPVDTGDGWGTNLNSTDLRSPGWNSIVIESMEEALRSFGCKSGFREKLGGMTHYDAPVGIIGPYFQKKFGLPENAVVLCGTGDNPATLLGCGGELVISLGSSYTVNGVLGDPRSLHGDEYNVFGYTPGHAMGLSVITNGAKLHDEFRTRYAAAQSWNVYEEQAGSRSISDGEPLMLPYLQDESVPHAPAGILRSGTGEDDAAANIRALHISQALSLKLHSKHITGIGRLAVVGGQSKNDILRSFLTDVFGVPSYRIRNGEAAAPLGCAIAAARYILDISYPEAAGRYVQIDPQSLIEPDLSLRPIYENLLKRYRTLEAENIDVK